MATHTLDFERPLLELERQIDEMKRVTGDTAVDVSKELAALERKLAELRGEIYRNLTPMQRVQVARHPKRPTPSTTSTRSSPTSSSCTATGCSATTPRWWAAGRGSTAWAWCWSGIRRGVNPRRTC